jgi:hypothetical protein
MRIRWRRCLFGKLPIGGPPAAVPPPSVAINCRAAIVLPPARRGQRPARWLETALGRPDSFRPLPMRGGREGDFNGERRRIRSYLSSGFRTIMLLIAVNGKYMRRPLATVEMPSTVGRAEPGGSVKAHKLRRVAKRHTSNSERWNAKSILVAPDHQCFDRYDHSSCRRQLEMAPWLQSRDDTPWPACATGRGRRGAAGWVAQPWGFRLAWALSVSPT